LQDLAVCLKCYSSNPEDENTTEMTWMFRSPRCSILHLSPWWISHQPNLEFWYFNNTVFQITLWTLAFWLMDSELFSINNQVTVLKSF
jgi:hypothetical protein